TDRPLDLVRQRLASNQKRRRVVQHTMLDGSAAKLSSFWQRAVYDASTLFLHEHGVQRMEASSSLRTLAQPRSAARRVEPACGLPTSRRCSTRRRTSCPALAF